jgi:hypothetical protein
MKKINVSVQQFNDLKESGKVVVRPFLLGRLFGRGLLLTNDH